MPSFIKRQASRYDAIQLLSRSKGDTARDGCVFESGVAGLGNDSLLMPQTNPSAFTRYKLDWSKDEDALGPSDC